jgi:SAM-dependent methyltransferase
MEERLRQIHNASSEQGELKRTMPRKEAVRVGNLIVLAQSGRLALNQYRQRLIEKSYQVSQTEHFAICQHPTTDQAILLHLFRPEEANADLICFIENELPSSGIIPSTREFGATLFAVLASMYLAPRDQQAIWLRFCLNSLNSLRDHIAHPPKNIPAKVSYIAPFATIYQRILELVTGQSLLDVGCCFGFLPVLMAERDHSMHIIGSDISHDAIGFSTRLANATEAHNVAFHQIDTLSNDFPKLGHFDSVTAIHLLEHLAEEDMPTALDHLLQVTTKCLLIAVPYEEQAQALYGHRQTFTPEKLHQWGMWCVETLEGKGKYRYEELMGGLLIIERTLD